MNYPATNATSPSDVPSSVVGKKWSGLRRGKKGKGKGGRRTAVRPGPVRGAGGDSGGTMSATSLGGGMA